MRPSTRCIQASNHQSESLFPNSSESFDLIEKKNFNKKLGRITWYFQLIYSKCNDVRVFTTKYAYFPSFTVPDRIYAYLTVFLRTRPYIRVSDRIFFFCWKFTARTRTHTRTRINFFCQKFFFKIYLLFFKFFTLSVLGRFVHLL